MHLHAPSLADFALRNHWSLMLLAIFIIPLCAVVTIHHWVSGRRLEASQSWLSAHGRVIKVTDDAHDDDTYCLRIEYEYMVNGYRYTAQRFGFGTGVTAKDKADLQVKIAEWPVGKLVQVWYDPQNPFSAALERAAMPVREDKVWGAALIALLVLWAALLDFGVIRFDS
jgi:hypothetical protein